MALTYTQRTTLCGGDLDQDLVSQFNWRSLALGHPYARHYWRRRTLTTAYRNANTLGRQLFKVREATLDCDGQTSDYEMAVSVRTVLPQY